MTKIKKFSVGLPEELDTELEKEADAKGISKTELIRMRLEQAKTHEQAEKGQGSTLEGTDTVPQKTFPEPEKPYTAPQKLFAVPKKAQKEPEKEWEDTEIEPEKPVKKSFKAPKYSREDTTVYVEPRPAGRGPLRTIAHVTSRIWDGVDSILTILWNTFALAVVVGVVYYLHHSITGGYLPGGEKVLAWYGLAVDWIMEVFGKLTSSSPAPVESGAGK